MAPKFSRERAALILAEASLFGDEATARRWGCSTRTVNRYRNQAITDPKLSESVALKKAMLLSGWQEDVVKAIKTALHELERRLPLAQSEEDAKVIHAISGALKICGELKITAEALQPDPVTS